MIATAVHAFHTDVWYVVVVVVCLICDSLTGNGKKNYEMEEYYTVTPALELVSTTG